MTTTTTFVWFALWCCCCSSFAVPLPDRRLRQADRVAADPATPDRVAADTAASDQPFDPSLDALADAKYDEADNDDREKRQLSFVQGKLLNFLKPLPVVDVTKEDEKYGNDGDKFNRIGRGFIGGVESVSNMLTSALSFPVDTAKKLSSRRMLVDNKVQYLCDICNKFFNKHSTLIIHRRTHTGEKPFHCDICDKSFAQSSYVPVHRRAHTGEKPYHCDVCDKSFSQRSHLTVHQRTHTGDKPYHCDVCDKSFAHSNTLALHQRTHTGEKPYHCDVCDKSFNRSSSLTRHQLTHKGDKSFTPFDKSFAGYKIK